MLLALTKPPRDAQKLIINQIKIGQAIRSQRIEYVEDLEEARAEKQEWVLRTTDLLKQLFSDSMVAEACNDWVGPILPEYAEWELFVEQFDKEMKHRIGRLTELAMQLEEPTRAPPLEQAQPQRAVEPAQKPVEHAASIATTMLRLPPDAASRKAIREFLESLIQSLGSAE